MIANSYTIIPPITIGKSLDSIFRQLHLFVPIKHSPFIFCHGNIFLLLSIGKLTIKKCHLTSYNMLINLAAQKLYLHPNTLRYRIEKRCFF
ncbi:helix-turn-helix domain-containing protein [Desulfosporosinus orientis]|uniref:helix-turn-helix domain-containing protein n=1 Tax=Desulfosporosinus orientis TaxID=1563 RepID=UPI0011D262B2